MKTVFFGYRRLVAPALAITRRKNRKRSFQPRSLGLTKTKLVPQNNNLSASWICLKRHPSTSLSSRRKTLPRSDRPNHPSTRLLLGPEPGLSRNLAT